MRFLTFGPKGNETPGCLIDGNIISLRPLLGDQGIEWLIAHWDALRSELPALLAEGTPIPLDKQRIGPPLLRPQKIIGVGANYCDQDGKPPKGPIDPILFFKPASSLTGPGDPIMLPPEAASVVAEVELVIVIGRGGRRVPPDEAMRHVFGYSMANDVTAPEVMLGDSRESPLFFQQGRGKGFPTFCPLGPWIVTADEITDPDSLLLEQAIDGSVELRGEARLMHHKIDVLVSEVSHAFGLEPGDIILSGSPRPFAGTRRRPLQAGSMLTSSISTIGALTNPIMSEANSAHQPLRNYSGTAEY